MMDIAAAEKKLRQAKFFVGYLEQASAEPIRRAGQPESEHLEFFFSACLSAAQSVHYVLEETGGSTFKTIKRNWLAGLKDERKRSSFGQMIGLRDKDVHLAVTGAKPLQKYVADDWKTHDRSPYYYQPQVYNAALFGPRPVIEEKNPDGTIVTGSVLRGTLGLYIERQGRRVEATDACREFIEQLTSLLDAMKGSTRESKAGSSE